MSALIKGETGEWEVIIGLEVHAQVISKSKLFSGAATDFGAEPNTQVSTVDAGFPGGEVTVMTGGAADELWLGTAQGFILRDVDGRLETIATPGDLSYGRVSSILVTAANQVWVTTLGAGLFLYDGERWHRCPQGETSR